MTASDVMEVMLRLMAAMSVTMAFGAIVHWKRRLHPWLPWLYLCAVFALVAALRWFILAYWFIDDGLDAEVRHEVSTLTTYASQLFGILTGIAVTVLASTSHRSGGGKRGPE